eukprot:scaffold3742_cov267-Chaetoceros_neogracile.AAC.12
MLHNSQHQTSNTKNCTTDSETTQDTDKEQRVGVHRNKETEIFNYTMSRKSPATLTTRSKRSSSDSGRKRTPAAAPAASPRISKGKGSNKTSANSSTKINSNKKEHEVILDAPRIVQGEVEFPLGPVQKHLTCKLCNGYLRCALTISECLHSFCKSCLFCAYNRGVTACPTCEVNLGPDPYSVTIYDRTLQELVDKVLPELQEIDNVEERLYYERNGIKPKIEFLKELEREKKQALHSEIVDECDGGDSEQGPEDDSESPSKQAKYSDDSSPRQSFRQISSSPKKPVPPDELNVELQPHQGNERNSEKRRSRNSSGNNNNNGKSKLPPLQNSVIRTSGRLKINQLKKFLMSQLKLDPSQLLELQCNGDTIGDELSLTFVQRTRWLKPDEDMILSYRLSRCSKVHH